MANETRTPGPMGGLGALSAVKKDKIKERQKKLEKEQKLMMKENFHTGAEKGYRKAESDYKKVDSGFKKRKSDDNKIKDSIFDSSMGKSQEVFDEIKASRREAGRTTKAKGGRAGYSVGGKAIRGVSKILLKK
jgi:hypothetical protein